MREIAEEDSQKKRVMVLFGTQTGTAEGFAKTVGEEARNRYQGQVLVPVIKLDEYAETDSEFQKRLQSESFVIFIMATYGDGEPTDDSVAFYRWLNSQSESEDGENEFLSGLSYAVFGLGNRQYEHFNVVGKGTDKQLSKLGAKRLLEVGLGDDDQCIEDDFVQWKQNLWHVLDSLVQEEGREVVDEQDFPAAIPEYQVEILQKDITEVVEANVSHSNLRRNMSKKGAGADLPLFRATISVRKELHSSLSDRSCVHIELDISESGLKYETGDHVALYAQNSPENVEKAAELLGLPPTTVFSLKKKDGSLTESSHGDTLLPDPFPGPCTLETALSSFADLLNSPKKTALLALAAHATNSEEAEKLRFLASPAGKEEYQKWIADSHRSLLEVMASYPSSHPPLGVFFASIAPRLQPRFYSISSSPRLAGESIHVTCAVVEETTPGGRLHRGVCSTWLKFSTPLSLAPPGCPPSYAPLYVRSSEFRLPSDPLTPLIMVGPGTGLAPFRGFLQERLALKREGKELGSAILFFGCRHSQKDFIYKEELEEFVREGVLSELHTAFSREGGGVEGAREKKYVQHLMQAQAVKVWRLLSEGGHLYVCGDAKAMAKDVHRTLHTIVQKQECVSGTQAEAIVKKLQDEKRYMRDVW